MKGETFKDIIRALRMHIISPMFSLREHKNAARRVRQGRLSHARLREMLRAK